MKTPTIYEIKALTAGNSPRFFDRKSMKFFGQTMRDFKVMKSPEERIFIYAPMRMDGKTVSYTLREFVPSTCALVVPRDGDELSKHDTLSDVYSFIHRH